MLETTENQNLQIGEFILSENENGNKSLEFEESFWKNNGKPSVEGGKQKSDDLEENLRRISSCEKNSLYHQLKTSPRIEKNQKLLFHWKMTELSDKFSTNDNYVNFRWVFVCSIFSTLSFQTEVGLKTYLAPPIIQDQKGFTWVD